MKSYFFKSFRKLITFLIYFVALIPYGTELLNSQERFFNEMQIDSTTKSEYKSSDLPSNPFEIVEMIRKANSMNDATEPSDAIDDALKSFNMIDEKEKL